MPLPRPVRNLRVWLRLLAGMVVALAATASPAQTLKVLTAGAMKSVVLAAVPAFDAREGLRTEVANDTAGGLQKRVAGGEAFDVIVLPMAGLEALARSGAVDPASVRPLARAGIGVAVRQGATRPDISSVEAFRQAMLGPARIAYIDPAAGGSSGIYLQGLFERLGIADAVRPRAVLVPGGLTAARLVSGEADIAVQQVSELLAVDGVSLVGLLPAEIQHHTVYGVALATRPTNRPEAARAFAAALRDAPALQALQRYALEPVR